MSKVFDIHPNGRSRAVEPYHLVVLVVAIGHM